MVSLHFTAILSLLSLVNASKFQPYPISELDPQSYKTYQTGDEINLQCINRQIDNGEHIFNEEGEIVYSPIFKCLENNKPFSFNYNIDSLKKCTVKFDDEIFHLFQLYLHKDAPFTCKFELRPNSGIYIPLDFSFRGNVLESHFDIDPNINLLMLHSNENELIAGTAFSSSLNTTKVIIGQNVEFNFNIKWPIANKHIINSENNIQAYYVASTNSKITWIFGIAGIFLGIVLTLIFSYKSINKKVQLSTWNKVE
ncbi:hypothetical protein DAPK24_045210 [Pichia kluyveri]|uniref:Uncharacterized protein n=1 Tax=Pichia kluyveri TaxID=36015 RepID=A0AAV5RAU0_PICKL|nr:hypothetical protein DAPK24_045210 [Pichia kluyveri]